MTNEFRRHQRGTERTRKPKLFLEKHYSTPRISKGDDPEVEEVDEVRIS